MRKRLLLNGFLIIVVLGAASATYATVRTSSNSAAATQSDATAKRGVVLQSVTSTGNVEAPQTLSLSFQQSGQVTQILVAPGDRVIAGEALAEVDDTQQSHALASAMASLASARANLAGLERGETSIERESDAASTTSAAQSVSTAEQGLTHAQQSQANNAVKYQQSVDQAQASLTSANAAVGTAKTNLNQANSALTTLQQSADPSHSSTESIAATITRYQSDQTSCQANSGNPSYHPSDGVDCTQISRLSQLATNVQSAQSSLTQAQSQQTTAQNGVTNAQQLQTGGVLQDNQAVENALSQLATAKNQYNSAVLGNAVKQQPAKPETLAQANASIASAEQQVASAQKNEDDTILRAPAAGTVASVNGVVGQQSGSGASSAASSSSGSTASASTNGSTSSSSSSSSSGFVVLTDVDVLDVSVGFTESDAPKVKVGQAATITLAALPNETFIGHVLSLDTDSTLVSNVVTYYAKVAFDGTPKDVKPGMTASVNVVLDKRDDVVTLPTSAVSTTGTSQTVTVKAKDGTETQRTITIGLRGDNAVEITSGLTAGEQVVITNTATNTGAANGLPAGGPGGLGGGGLGGGGLGGGARP